MINDTYRDNKFWSVSISIYEFLYKLFPLKKANRKWVLELKEEVKNSNCFEKTTSIAHNEWIKHAKRVENLILEKDPSNFLQWAVVKDTMNVTNAKFILEEIEELKNTHSWESKWKKIIKEERICGQPPFIFYPKSSGNTIHLTYVVSKFYEKADTSMKDVDFIFEVGGGYGNLCRIIHKLGFKGKYIIFDMPVFSFLQKFYLKSAGLSIVKNITNNNEHGIYLINNEKSIEKIKALYTFEKNKSLFLATWSLSEMPLNIRSLFSNIFSKFGYFIIGYQDKFGEVDNKEYFKDIQKSLSNIKWEEWPLKHLPAHNLLIGLMKK